MSKILLAYCIENQTVATKIANALQGKMEIERIIFDQNNGIEQLEAKTNQSTTPALVLISDNFLKTVACLDDALRILQGLGNTKRLIPVTTEGVYPQNNNGEFTTVPTSFDRVSNVIQYMNYWQDQYLELRRGKPDNMTETAFNEKVKTVRSISTEIGELLRFLRAIEYFSFDQFQDSNYIILYRLLGLEVSPEMERLQKIAVDTMVLPEVKIEQQTMVASTKVETVVESVVAEYKNGHNGQGLSLEDILDNDRLETLDTEIEEPQIDVNTIPGYSMLQNRVIQQPEPPILNTPDTLEKDINFEEKANFHNNALDMINQGLDTPSTLEALIEEIKNDSHLEFDTPSVPSATRNLEITSDDDRKVEEVLNEMSNTRQATSFNNFTLTNDDKKDLELVQLFESKNNPIEQLTASSLSHDVQNQEPIDEEKIKQEVSRIFTETNEVPTVFEYETPVSQHLQPEIEAKIPVNTEGVSEKSLLEISHEALSKDPLNQNLRFQYADALMQHHRFQEALEQLEILIEEDRKNVEAYMMMAYAAEQSGDYLLSLNCLEKVSLLDPNFPNIFYKLGNLVNEHFKNHKRKAHRYYKDAIHANPNNGDAYYQLAVLDLEQNNDWNTVIDYLNKAVLHQPNHSNASFELAKAYYEIGEKAQAAHFYGIATEANPSIKTKINDDIFKFEIAEPEPDVNDNGKVVLITGATSGIGRATAEIFAKNGYRLILTGRRGERLEAIKTVFEEDYKNRNEILEFDVRNVKDVNNAIADLSEDFRNVDILINNAGLASGLAPIHEGDIDDWEKMIDTNIKGLLYMTRAIAPHMVNRQKGHIINICSIAGKEIYPNGNVYIASKHAVDALTRAMRSDLYKYNIRVSQVAPGMVEETEFALVRFHGDTEKAKIYEDIQPLKAADVADMIYYIASREEYINIQDVVMMCTQQGSANLYNRNGRNSG